MWEEGSWKLLEYAVRNAVAREWYASRSMKSGRSCYYADTCPAIPIADGHKDSESVCSRSTCLASKNPAVAWSSTVWRIRDKTFYNTE